MAMVDVKTQLGRAIKTQRASLGISQEELAYRAGLHRTYVSDVERGVRNPSIETIEKLAGALEISTSTLFDHGGNGGRSSDLVDILLVEDNPEDVNLTRGAFKKARLTNPLHVVSDGAAALDFVFAAGAHTHRARMRRPLLVLLDLSLPGMSGLEVLRAIKADARGAKIPVIVLTVSDRLRDMAECRRLGAERYIVKPVRFQSFSEVTPFFELEWTLLRRAGREWPR
jgi:CheY-like chemotaxis protein